MAMTAVPLSNRATGRLSVVLVEHDRLFARGLELLLDSLSEARVQVVGHAADAGAALDLVRHQHPDVVIVGLSLPPPGGLTAIRDLKGKYPALRVLALCGTDDVDATVGALRAGADGVLLKSSPPDALVAPLLSLAAGLSVLPGPVLEALVEGPARRDQECLRRLGADERQLWRLVAEGLDTVGIGRRLFISERTAKRKINYLLRRIGVDNRVQAAALAGRCGLLDEVAGGG